MKYILTRRCTWFDNSRLFQRFNNATSESITGTSTNTPTTVANAAPECKPNKEIATATANSKKLLVVS